MICLNRDLFIAETSLGGTSSVHKYCDVTSCPTSGWPLCEPANFLFSLDPLVLDEPDCLKRRYYWCLHLSDFHMKRHALFTCRVSPLFCPVGMLAAVNGVTLCLFQVCRREANWGVCVWVGNQTCCFSCRSIYHLLKCRMKLRQGKVSGVCMRCGRETDTLCRSLSASLFQLISPQVSTACECILKSFLSFSKQFRITCENIISL